MGNYFIFGNRNQNYNAKIYVLTCKIKPEGRDMKLLKVRTDGDYDIIFHRSTEQRPRMGHNHPQPLSVIIVIIVRNFRHTVRCLNCTVWEERTQQTKTSKQANAMAHTVPQDSLPWEEGGGRSPRSNTKHERRTGNIYSISCMSIVYCIAYTGNYAETVLQVVVRN